MEKFQLQSCIMAIFSFKSLSIFIFRFLKHLYATFNISVISGIIFYCLVFFSFLSVMDHIFLLPIMSNYIFLLWNCGYYVVESLRFCVYVPPHRWLSFILVDSYFIG